MPTTGSGLNVSTSASGLILHRKAILPSLPRPTTWPLPIELRGRTTSGTSDYAGGVCRIALI